MATAGHLRSEHQFLSPSGARTRGTRQAGFLAAQPLGLLRRLIDALRMVRGNARDLTIPPPDSSDLAFLARRMGYGGAAALLSDDIQNTLAAVQAVTDWLI